MASGAVLCLCSLPLTSHRDYSSPETQDQNNMNIMRTTTWPINFSVPICLIIILALHQSQSFVHNRHAQCYIRPPSPRTVLVSLPSTSTAPTILLDDEEPLSIVPVNGGGDDATKEESAKKTKVKFIPPTFDKSEDESAFIKSTLMTNFMFSSLPAKTLDKGFGSRYDVN